MSSTWEAILHKPYTLSPGTTSSYVFVDRNNNKITVTYHNLEKNARISFNEFRDLSVLATFEAKKHSKIDKIPILPTSICPSGVEVFELVGHWDKHTGDITLNIPDAQNVYRWQINASGVWDWVPLNNLGSNNWGTIGPIDCFFCRT